MYEPTEEDMTRGVVAIINGHYTPCVPKFMGNPRKLVCLAFLSVPNNRYKTINPNDMGV